MARTARTPGRRSRPGAARLLSAAVLGGALAAVGVVTGAVHPVSAALLSAGTPATVQPRTAQEAAALVAQPRAVEFLDAMRAARIPTSRAGIAEVLTARAVCAELAAGTDEAQLPARVPGRLPTVSRRQAATLVDLAERFYC